MDKIDNVKDETIRTLAQTLKSSGLAASETEAIRMATNMAQTNTKVNNNFEERKEKNIMGLSFLHKEKNHELPKQKITEEVVYAEEEPKMQPRYEESMEEIQQKEETNEEYAEENCSSCGCCAHEEINEKRESLNELFEAETKDEFIKQDLLDEQIKEEEPEITREIPVQKKETKRDLSEYKESKVDLGDVFKFRG
jgi:hypothetical protein